MTLIVGAPERTVLVTDPENQVTVTVVTDLPSEVVTVGIPGPRGPSGAATLEPFTYVMPVAQTTAVIDHNLGRNPVAVQVLDESGVVAEEFGVTFTIDGSQLRVSFDVAVRATIRFI